MKIFIDTANLEEIRQANEMGVLDGVTTNPTLVSKEDMEFNELIKEITKIVDGPISVEALSDDHEGMIKEGQKLTKIHKNITIKIPMTREGLKATKALTGQGIKVNMTLCFSPNQAILAAKAGATFVSPFIGRLDDISYQGLDLLAEMIQIYQNYDFATEIIAASIRNPVHVFEAAKMGVDICTIPFKVIDQLLKHPLTDIGIQRFKADWQKVKVKE